MSKKKKIILAVIPAVIVLAVLIGMLPFLTDYYHADSAALESLVSDETVTVSSTGYGSFFDGPSKDTGLIFYPGAKVESTAYAPLCKELAKNGFDVCLVDMPLRIAFLGINKADKIMADYDYDNWYIAGHSLGGVSASHYASDNPDKLDGVILLASFSVHKLDDSIKTILIYGSEDKVLAMDKYEPNQVNNSADSSELIIPGGNHAGFGSYGAQEGDGTALISQKEQVDATVKEIVKKTREQ